MRTFFEELGKKFGETAECVTNKAGEMMEIQKIKSQIRALEKGNEEDFLSLGYMVYKQFQEGETLSMEATGLCEAIQSRDESIDEYEKQIMDVKGDFICEHCGKTVLKGMAYCPYCGAKTSEEYTVQDQDEDDLEEAFAEDPFVDETEKAVVEEAVEEAAEEVAEEAKEENH